MRQHWDGKTLTTLKILLTLVFVAVGIYYVWLRREEFASLEWPSGKAIAIVGAAFIANICIMSLFNTLVARKLGANISMLESFALSMVTSAANFVLPFRAGTGFRGMYMKRVYGLSYSNFASTLVVFYICNIFIASLLGTVAVAVVYFDRGYFALDLFLSFPLIFLGSAAFIMLQRGQDASTQDHTPWWLQLWSGYRGILGEKSVILYALFLVLLSFAISTVAWHFALQEYIAGITAPDSFLIVASQVLGGLIPLTAGGTGIQELAGIYVGHRLEMTIVNLFAVLVWTKILRIIISVSASAPAAIYLRRRSREI